MSQLAYRQTHALSGVLTLVTGLRIGAGKDTVEIGGIDNPIVKHPHSQDPYIPGSSLKGKLRSLLEWAFNRVESDGKVWGASGRFQPGDEILRIFGATHKDWVEGPARALFRDLSLLPEWRAEIVHRGLPLSEDKFEVVIDRISGKAAGTGPRTMERIPAGARFSFEILFREFAVDNDSGKHDRRCLNRLIEALRLLELDALGGSGSRGYGQVHIDSLALDSADLTARFREFSRFNPAAPFPFIPWEA